MSGSEAVVSFRRTSSKSLWISLSALGMEQHYATLRFSVKWTMVLLPRIVFQDLRTKFFWRR